VAGVAAPLKAGDFRGYGQSSFQLPPPDLKRFAAQIPRSLAKQVEENDGDWNLPGKKFHAGCGGVNPKLQRFEIERAVFRDDDLAIEHAARGQLRP
jgi:hypothetical protein